MAQEFKLPDLGEGIHEGEITKVLVSEGATVVEDQPILEVETDKAAVEIPSPYAGTVARIHVKQGDLVHVGDLLITFDVAKDAKAEKGPAKEKAVAPKEPPKKAPEQREGPVAASPATRRLARELGVDLQAVPGSGPGGLVTAEDVRAFASRAEAKTEEKAVPEEEPKAQREEPSAVRPSTVSVPPLPDFGRWGRWKKSPCAPCAGRLPSTWRWPGRRFRTSSIRTWPTSPSWTPSAERGWVRLPSRAAA